MIELTDGARAKIQSLVEAEVVRDPALRIGLLRSDEPHSPLGRAYDISLVEREDKAKTEIAINLDGIRVLRTLDPSDLLSGAEIDWSDEAGGFTVESEADRRRRAAPAPARPAGAFADNPLADRVQAVFDTLINPRIAMHGGAVELVDVADDVIYVRMSGGCQGCAASALTLRQGVERMVMEEVPEVREVVDLTDHTAGVNPYY